MTRKKTHKQLFGTHPVPGQSRKFVYVYVFFLFLTFVQEFSEHGLQITVCEPPLPFTPKF